MDITEAEEVSKKLNSALVHIKWRLKSSSKRRLEIDVLALCSKMRPCVMVDYGGIMPELQKRLCSLFEVLHKESTIFQQLRVMVIDEMIYMVNVREFAEYVAWSLSSDAKLFFVDLEQDPPKMIQADEQTSAIKGLFSVCQLFSSVFTPDGVKHDAVQEQGKDQIESVECSLHDKISRSCEVINLSSIINDYPITIPTLNGWLLGYPVIYLFGVDHISDAIYNLTTKHLHLFKVLYRRNPSHTGPSSLEEIMSFSVPCDLSTKGRNEPWAETFWLQVQAKQEKCKNVWRSMQMDVSEFDPQAIAF